jgi:hypothetical protein
MSITRSLFACIFWASVASSAIAQPVVTPITQLGGIGGIVTDVNDGIIPGATIDLEGAVPGDAALSPRRTTDHSVSTASSPDSSTA